MIINKPSILIYGNKPDQDILKEICAGIEEEGVLYDVIYQEGKDLDSLSFDGANDSILGSGIGVHGSRIALQLRIVAKDKPVFLLDNPSLAQSRNLGANAARAVKRMPFKII